MLAGPEADIVNIQENIWEKTRTIWNALGLNGAFVRKQSKTIEKYQKKI